MFTVFERYTAAQAVLTSGELRYIRALCTERHLRKKDFILHQGEMALHTHFVAKGLLKLYRNDDVGNEHILKFAHENRWISDRESYVSGRPSLSNIKAIETSDVLSWRKRDFDQLLNEIPAFRELMKNLSARSQAASQQRVYMAISQSAEDKYTQFLNNNPAIRNRVPLHMIASYLGLSRETLSRIRKQQVKKT